MFYSDDRNRTMNAVAATVLALANVGAIWRWHQAARARGGSLELVAIACGVSFFACTVSATLLVLLGSLHPLTSVPLAVLILGLFARRAQRHRGPQTPRPARSASELRYTLSLALLIMIGVALRAPPIAAPLAGRDQGTYTLRAEHIARTGGHAMTDEILARVGASEPGSPGRADILGLYHVDGAPWRSERYEAAHRPGSYLADRERGELRPQFFHAWPAYMAMGRQLLGRELGLWWNLLPAICVLLSFAAICQRMFGSSPWTLVATGWLVLHPLAIWTHRTPLSESATQAACSVGLLASLIAHSETHVQRRWTWFMIAAFALACVAWIRGNAFIYAASCYLCLLGRTRESPQTWAFRLWLFGLWSSWVVHCTTSYPYVHDELLRQLPGDFHPSPGHLVATGSFAGFILVILDACALRHPRPRAWLERTLALTPKLISGLVVLGLASYLALKWGQPERPYARLDPALPSFGLPLIFLSLAGILIWQRRFRPTPGHAWLMAYASIPLVTLLWYVPRNLPNAGLYYYGRYLVPELLPAVLLAAVYATRELTQQWQIWLKNRGRTPGQLIVPVLGVLGVTASFALVLVTHPQTRLREFESAGKLIDALDAALPADAVVIAGGEGWHHGHTFNQVAGALAIGRGRPVLPYISREAAYASMHALAIAEVAASGGPPPSLFLLLNEASKPHTRGENELLAGIDDHLFAPFRARRRLHFELIVHRLTPDREQLPTRVTRDTLRLALIEVERSPALASSLRKLATRTAPTPHAIAELPQRDAPAKPAHCVPKRSTLSYRWPDGAPRDGHIVLVAAPGRARDVPRWRVELDGQRHSTTAPGLRTRHRDTLGPIPVPRGARKLELSAPQAKKIAAAACPYGEILELRWLPDENAPSTHVENSIAKVVMPADDLGFPMRSVSWVRARAWNRYRPGTWPQPEIVGRGMRLEAEKRVNFAPASWQPESDAPAEVIVVVSQMSVPRGARLHLAWSTGRGDPHELEVELPEGRRRRSWQSRALSLQLAPGMVGLSLRLSLGPSADTGAAEHFVDLRDVTLFAPGPITRLGRP